MERIERLIEQPRWIKELNDIEQLESTRIYCHHGLSHLLDVARISWILVLERQLPFSKPVVYAAALLHDIGRAQEYRFGCSHDEASVELARELLPVSGFSDEEIDNICVAIMGHRHEMVKTSLSGLQLILKEADWRSRNCFHCEAEKSCKWDESRKNRTIIS